MELQTAFARGFADELCKLAGAEGVLSKVRGFAAKKPLTALGLAGGAGLLLGGMLGGKKKSSAPESGSPPPGYQQ